MKNIINKTCDNEIEIYRRGRKFGNMNRIDVNFCNIVKIVCEYITC